MKNKHVLLLSLLLGMGLFVIILIGSILLFGNIGSAIAWMNGESFYIYPKTVDLGNNESKANRVATFYMRNLSTKDITIVGEKSSCSCAFSEQIPLVAKPGETVKIKVNINLATKERIYDQTIIFMIAEPKHLTFHPVRVLAKVANMASLHENP